MHVVVLVDEDRSALEFPGRRVTRTSGTGAAFQRRLARQVVSDEPIEGGSGTRLARKRLAGSTVVDPPAATINEQGMFVVALLVTEVACDQRKPCSASHSMWPPDGTGEMSFDGLRAVDTAFSVRGA